MMKIFYMNLIYLLAGPKIILGSNMALPAITTLPPDT